MGEGQCVKETSTIGDIQYRAVGMETCLHGDDMIGRKSMGDWAYDEKQQRQMMSGA